MTHGSSDIVVDGIHAFRTFERDSSGSNEEILILDRMALEFCMEV